MSEQKKLDAKLIERIQKILAKTAENGCTAEEAEAAVAKANKLLMEHNLTMDDVRSAGGQAEEKFLEEEVKEAGRWTLIDQLAYGVVKKFFFVEGSFGYLPGRKHKILYLFGTESNVATARFVFNALLSAADRLWLDYKHGYNKPQSESRLFKTGVMKGFSDKLAEERKAMEMERDIMAGASGGTALALRRVEDLTIQKFREKHPQTKSHSTSYATGRGSASTLEAGYKAGRNLRLNREIGGTTQRALE